MSLDSDQAFLGSGPRGLPSSASFFQAVYLLVFHMDVSWTHQYNNVHDWGMMFTFPLVCFFLKLLFNRLLFCELSLKYFIFNSIFHGKLCTLSN